MQRRNFMKTAASIGTIAATGAGITALSGTGAAATAEFSISGTSATTEDGNIKRVTVNVDDFVATWDGFDEPVDAVAYVDTLTIRPNSDAVEHVLFDNSDNPVLLDNWSSQGDGSDGWGGPDEYVAGRGSPSDQHYSEQGEVHAGINWNIIVDPNYASAKSVETPFPVDGESVIEPTTDGETKTSTIAYEKRVLFFKKNASGSTTTEDGTAVVPMGGDDGTRESVAATADLMLDVTNEAAETTAGGSGSSSAE